MPVSADAFLDEKPQSADSFLDEAPRQSADAFLDESPDNRAPERDIPTFTPPVLSAEAPTAKRPVIAPFTMEEFGPRTATAENPLGVATPEQRAFNAAQASEFDKPAISAKTVESILARSPGAYSMLSALPLSPKAREVVDSFKQSTAEQISGMTSQSSAAALPAFAIPYVGPALAMGLGAKAVGAGAGKTVAGLESGNMSEVGGGLSEAAGGALMTAAPMLHGGGEIARPEIPPRITETIAKTEAAVPGALNKSIEALKKVENPTATTAVETKPTEVSNASSQPNAEGSTQREVRPRMGEETPLRQQGEIAGVQPQIESTGPREPARAQAGAENAVLLKQEAPKYPDLAADVAREGAITERLAAIETEKGRFDAMADPEFKALKKELTGLRTKYDMTLPSKVMQETTTADPTPKSAEISSKSVVEPALPEPAARKANVGVEPAAASQAITPNAPETITSESAAGTPAVAGAEGGIETQAVDPQSGLPLPEKGLSPARLGEVGETAPTGKEPHGIAQRVREQRREQGITGPVEPGQGISAADSVERGRSLLQEGRSPEDTVALFEKTKSLSADDMAVVRAHGENLAREANAAADKFGVNSPEYEAAWEKGFEWDRRTKPMQTEWHKIGQAQQGEVQIDTGTFHGLRRAFNEDSGRDFTPAEAETAKGKAAKVKKATAEAETAKSNLYKELDRLSKTTDAEAAARQAASKTVREAAARAADEVTKARVREGAAEKEVQRIKAAPEKRAEAAASKTVREAAARAAKAEKATAEKRAAQELKSAQEARKAAERKAEKANADIRSAAIKAAKAATAERVAKADLPTYVWTKAREYIAEGMDDFNDIRNKLATDLGMPVDKITAALGKDKRAKYLSDELWKKQQVAREVKAQAKRWLTQATIPGYLRALQMIPRAMFGLKVGFHGTVALGTHAPMVAFQPRFWETYVRDFGKMYKMVGSKAYYENQVQDLVRRPNYTTARRAGLVNDPFTYEDYNSPDTAKYFGNLTGMGNRGYTVLKILRQDMFDQMWGNLPKTAQVPEVASALADGLNHATGVVKGSAPVGANLALFAPRLEASRVAWLAVDPVKALMSVADWKNATQGEKIFALNQFKEKAWVAGTLFALLALNQGFLKAIGSKQDVNMSDPMKSDFLKFKAGGMTASYGNAMISMARLPVRLYQIRESDGGKLKNLVHPDESTYTVLGEYVRSQLHPLASLMSSLLFKSDWQNRPLPNSTRDVPKRLKAQGVRPYTWTEFFAEQALPIPFEEAAREVWHSGLGMNEEEVQHIRKAMATIAVMGATGGRLVEDQSVQPKLPPTP